ncbi:Phage integrase [uncultured Eubacteriales bacterium]|uniref:Phage integrase n=1 Tax=uncultured Eubacteriales bacterium TaxID=172733 RepID=A0A212JI30_9FIRM|nr:Phage integrase [uncultured Eubacteriales bacterium]
MSVSERTVKNKRNSSGELTGRSGLVYDVNIKYRSSGQTKTHSKKGFATKKAALEYEAAMRAKLINPSYAPPTAAQSKRTIGEYMDDWIENHGKANLRPSTLAGYKSNIKNHIKPHIGDIALNQLTPARLDKLFADLSDEGLSQSSIRYVQRILSVALEHARKYHYIEGNPTRDIITRFGKQGKTPDPYTVDQMKTLMGSAIGTPLELTITLAGLYGLRISEILGLRWRNVNLKEGTFAVVEQLPYDLPRGTTCIKEMAPVKSSERVLPITATTLPLLEQQLASQQRQRAMLLDAGGSYFDNDLVISKPDGRPEGRVTISSKFALLLKQLGMPHIRFHDLRHTAATNMHELTGDFYTISQILGHSLKGVGIQLNIPTSMNAVTARYVDVRLERKNFVLDAYHSAIYNMLS